MTAEQNVPGTCHDCGAVEGGLHERGCDMERCPFCGGQLITCGCSYRQFYPFYDDEYVQGGPYGFELRTPMYGLPEAVYEHGLPDEQAAEWERRLAAKGRIPYIRYPNLCVRCGMQWPEMFSVSTEEWERYVEPAQRRGMLCRPCYQWVKEHIDEAARKRVEMTEGGNG